MMNKGSSKPKMNLKRSFSTALGTESSHLQVKVFVRVRPFNDREKTCTCRKVVNVVDKTSLIFDPEEEDELFYFKGVPQKSRDITRRLNKNLHFEFDQVFDQESTNQEVFEASTKNIISSIFEGYNCSVFAYGATGAGKTFTMLGTPEHPGIAYLTIVELLKFIDQAADIKVTLGASYLEVYNENVKDLLYPSSNVLHLREDAAGGRITVSGLKVKQIDHADELFALLSAGNRNRSQHPTDSNAESSRSHAVFQVHARIVSNGQVKISKLSMIDLAGSERGAATGCKGMRFKEGSNINKSLLALGNCINALADGLKHVPYRDSKLTRILKDSLGGNCQTIMIANISPSSSSFEDTYNTLKYATRTKCIKATISKNVMNESLSIPQYKKMVQELNAKITEIQGGLSFPDISNWKNKIETLFEERRKLYKEILLLQSQGKLTNWRIRQKVQALSHHDPSSKLQCLDRLATSISQLKARSDSIRGRIAEYRPLQEQNDKQIEKLEEEIKKEEKIGPMLQLIFDYQKGMVELEEHKIRCSHFEKIVKLKAKHEESLNSTIKTVLPVLNQYHTLIKSNGQDNPELTAKYEDALRSLDGVKGVSWLGDEEEEEEDSEDYIQLRLNSIKENDVDLQNGAKSLTTTFFLSPIYQLSKPKNNRIGNGTPSPAKKPKFILKSANPRINFNMKTPVPSNNKENIMKRTPLTSTGVKLKTPAVPNRSNNRPHPYRRTPLKQNISNVANKTIVNRTAVPEKEVPSLKRQMTRRIL